MSPPSTTDAIFARAYASFVKSQLGAVDTSGRGCVLVSPITQRGIAGGDLILKEVTNYLIYKMGDGLVPSDNPTLSGVKVGSYIDHLIAYMGYVQTKSSPDQIIVDRMAKARNSLDLATWNYNDTLAEGAAAYKKVADLYPNMDFWQWANDNYPSLSGAAMTKKNALSEFYAASQAYYGPDAARYSDYVKRLQNAKDSNSLPLYNQAGMLADLDLINKAIERANGGKPSDDLELKNYIARVPAYTISDYHSTVQAWITKAAHGGKRENVFSIDVKEGSDTSWEDYGFKEVNGGGVGGGFWPFFFAEVWSNNKWEKRTLETEGREASVKIQLSMIGITKVDITPGEWNANGIKTDWPNLLPDAPPNILGPKFARIGSLLVGYDVELKVEFGSEMRKEVNEIYEEITKKGGRMSIFGFEVFVGLEGSGEERVKTEFKDVQWDQASGSITMAPTKGQVYPTILGALAQRFE